MCLRCEAGCPQSPGVSEGVLPGWFLHVWAQGELWKGVTSVLLGKLGVFPVASLPPALSFLREARFFHRHFDAVVTCSSEGLVSSGNEAW